MLAALGAGAARLLIDDADAADEAAPPAFALPTRPVLLIGLVGLCAVFGEQAGTAVSAFAGTMAAVRLVGDRVIHALGPWRRSSPRWRSPQESCAPNPIHTEPHSFGGQSSGNPALLV